MTYASKKLRVFYRYVKNTCIEKLLPEKFERSLTIFLNIPEFFPHKQFLNYFYS